MIDKSKFKNPDSIYRSAPFWSLNDKLCKDELLRQLGEFKSKGIGGAFLHPRGGMSTEYLSDDFFDAISACIEYMEENDMTPWLYDEDRFPSGVAGGRVTAISDDYAQKKITATYMDEDRGELLEKYDTDNKTLYIKKNQGYKQARFDGNSYVDVCSKEAIDAFIDITHEAYKERFRDKFGKTIHAIFTDEPSFNPAQDNALPWTNGFDEQFLSKKGYDILPILHELFIETGNYKKTRFDYWDVIAGMFVDAFSKNVYDWCDKNNIAYTGHFWEHVFPSPKHSGSVMPHYEYMHIPGIDMLFVADEKSKVMYGNDLNLKEVASVANQFGRKRVLTETHGASGWGLDFKYQKRATDWQLSQGINLFCQHLSLYSIKGYRKRDFPQSFLDHQPWWKDYAIMADYMGRMSYALVQGKYQCDVLLLHPSSSTWVEFSPFSDDMLEDISASVKGLVKYLNRNRIMFDIGDDIIMSKHGEVRGGKYVIGDMQYSTIILPKMTVMRDSVWQSLKAFEMVGGQIIATDSTPSMLDGVFSRELVDFFKDIPVYSYDEVLASLISMDVKRVEIEEENGKSLDNIYCNLRKQDEMYGIFVCNLDLKQRVDVRLYFDQPYSITAYDGKTGEGTVCSMYSKAGKFYIKQTLYAIGSVYLQVDTNNIVLITDERDAVQGNVETIDDFDKKLNDYNAINIQKASVLIDDSIAKSGDVLEIDDHIKDELGLERGNIFAKQPWMYTQDEKNDVHSIEIKYSFEVGESLDGNLQAAIEFCDEFNVYINDVLVKATDKFYKDRAFRLYNIKEYVGTGRNTITLKSDKYGVLNSVESIYIVGNFRYEDSLLKNPVKLSMGDITNQGYPYYSGIIDYTFTYNHVGNNAVLEFDEFMGVTAEVLINGESVKSIGWEPYSIDITNQLSLGDNIITIRLANSLQNLLGPHDADENQNLVTPGSFYTNNPTVFAKFGFDGNVYIRTSSPS